jgi:lipoprotein-anchoring transpeptidase ErfK/SrfK
VDRVIDRRSFLIGLGAAALVHNKVDAHPRPSRLDPAYEAQYVDFPDFPAGVIIVDPKNRFLYFVEAPFVARRYGVGVGRKGLAFKGSAIVGQKAEWPSWRPTEEMIKRSPEKYARFAEGMPGGPDNPLGARALYLHRDGRDTFYRIHGTNEPHSIGRAVSNGCIRMLNEHIAELYDRVDVGTPVLVM